jgi:hypothetical protein
MHPVCEPFHLLTSDAEDDGLRDGDHFVETATDIQLTFFLFYRSVELLDTPKVKSSLLTRIRTAACMKLSVTSNMRTLVVTDKNDLDAPEEEPPENLEVLFPETTG